MEAHQLPFAVINIIRNDIAEVIVNDGVEMNINMVEQYHDFLLSHLSAPFSLLINKVNSYTYDFEAQEALATLSEINTMAVVVYNDISRASTASLASFPREEKWHMDIFYDRLDALNWLILQQDSILPESLQ